MKEHLRSLSRITEAVSSIASPPLCKCCQKSCRRLEGELKCLWMEACGGAPMSSRRSAWEREPSWSDAPTRTGWPPADRQEWLPPQKIFLGGVEAPPHL